MIRRIGERITLVGVAHVLPESKKEVERLIVEEKPDFVGVELCYRRFIALTSEKRSESSFKLEFSRMAILAGILRFLQERIGEKTGMFPGEEMLTAVRIAKEVDAQVELIDRDINLTLQRLLDRTSLWEKLRILMNVLVSSFHLEGEVDLRDIAEEEVVEELISSFRDFSETAYEVLIEERDRYMADRISTIAGSKSGKILCVVGAGHIPGLSRELESRLSEGPI